MKIPTAPARRVIVALATAATVLLSPSAFAMEDPADPPAVSSDVTTEPGTVVDGEATATATSDPIVQPPDEVAAEEEASSEPDNVELTAASYWLTCQVKATNPHYSNGASGVIAKLIVLGCQGNHAGTMEVNGYLYRYKPGEIHESGPRATNLLDYMAVYPGMSKKAFYVPVQGSPGIYCNLKHWYQASWSSKLYLLGVASATKTPLSKMVHPQKCA